MATNREDREDLQDTVRTCLKLLADLNDISKKAAVEWQKVKKICDKTMKKLG